MAHLRRLFFALTALGAVAAGCSDAGGVDPDAIDGQELEAVQRALDSTFRNNPYLDSALTGDTGLYVQMATLVFQFVDRASRVVSGSDTTRVVGIEVDIDATTGRGSVVSNFTAILGWNGYRSETRTVDSVFFILGAGRAPVDDTLTTHFAPDTAGTGTGFVIHQEPDSSLTIWLARGEHLRTTASTYGAGHALSGGGVTLTTYRGRLNGEFTITAKQVPDSMISAVASVKDFGSGARALKVRIRGDLP